MPSTYTTNNGIELIATGEQSGTWGTTTNTNLELLDASLDGQVTITLSSAGSSGSPNDLPVTNGSASNGRNRVVIFNDGGDLGATAYVQLTPNDAEKIVYIRNSLSGSRDIIVFQGTYNASNDYVVPNGTTAVVFFDGAGTGAVAANVFNNAAFDALQLGTSDVSVNKILDQDDMSGNDASALATQQSIKAYVDSQVGTVDTLAEILANGNTTGGTDIAVGTGDDITFADSSKAIFGAGSDLQIYHDASDSIILDNGTGNLKIQADDLVLKSADGVKEYLKGTSGGSVRIRYNNTTVLETTSTGIDVTGTAVTDGVTVAGNILLQTEGNELQFNTSSTPVNKIYSDDTYTSNGLTISADNGVALKSTNNYLVLDDTGTNEMVLNVDNGERMRVTSTGIDVTGSVTADGLTIDAGGSRSYFNSSHVRLSDDHNVEWGGGTNYVRGSNANNRLVFATNGSERMRIDSSGNVGIGTSSPSYDLDVDSTIHIGNDGGSGFTHSRLILDANGATRAAGIFSHNQVNDTEWFFGNPYDTPDKFAINRKSTTTHSDSTADDSNSLVTVNSSGQVGIGTTSPSYNLSVVGSSAAIQIDNTAGSPNQTLMIFQADMGTNDRNFQIKSPSTDSASDPFRFTTANSFAFEIDSESNALVIDHLANVGIGTAPSGVKFDVSDTTDTSIRVRSTGTGASDDTVIRSLVGGTTASNYIFFGDSDDANAGQIRYVHSDDSMRISAGATTERLRLYSTSTIFYNGATEIARFASNNNLGIGTSSPANNLHVNSGGNTVAKISSTFSGSTTTGLYIDTVGDTSAARLLFSKSGTTRGLIGYSHNAASNLEAITFGTAGGTERMRINATGVGVGTSSPAEEIHISAATPTIRLQDSDGTNQYTNIYNSGGSANFLTRNDSSYAGFNFIGFDGTTTSTFSQITENAIQQFHSSAWYIETDMTAAR